MPKLEIFTQIKQLDGGERRAVVCSAVVMFLLLFSYPIIRSTTTAFFLDAYGAKQSPHVWLFSVIALVVVISLYNRLQRQWQINRLFRETSLLTLLIFGVSFFLFTSGWNFSTYFLYVWKEVYIVLLVHMTLGFLNASVDMAMAKVIYGPLGAVGSLGGVLGGMVTSIFTKSLPVEQIFLLGLGFIFLSALIFYFFCGDRGFLIDGKSERPLDSLGNVKKYVFYIALVVMLTQFCINLMNFKFNIVFTELFTDKVAKTAFLGKLYSLMNSLSLVVQILVVPLAFKFFAVSRIHQTMPFIYFVGVGASLFIGGGIWPVAGCFLFMKGLDYSLFAAAKEILYFPLGKEQKYGAKYAVDMITYRFSKGLISFVLIFVQAPQVINFLLMTFLGLWFILLIPLFRAEPNSENT